ncbi:MAG: polysaccharide deacetylase family protein [Oscillospiraceae bacterium]|jgi:peptidoglycan/xylan/chitin deacetylase (PgdA/CDA1 family)|nr:polysaccharide deacetylase family protein [Oscillospiraceae bacterium]
MKVIFVRLRVLILLLLAVGIGTGLAYWISPGLFGAPAARLMPVMSVSREYNTAALTFDVSENSADVEVIIDVLARHGVRATFFVTGEWARAYPDSASALAQAGHEVMSHSDAHAHMTRMSSSEIESDVRRAGEAIAAATGVTPALFRIPYGEYDDKVITAVNSAGMTAIQWDVDSLDWKGADAADIQKRVIKETGPGSIILFNLGATHTAAALPGVIQTLQRDGFDLCAVSEMLHYGEYSVDSAGRQMPG